MTSRFDCLPKRGGGSWFRFVVIRDVKFPENLIYGNFSRKIGKSENSKMRS